MLLRLDWNLANRGTRASQEKFFPVSEWNSGSEASECHQGTVRGHAYPRCAAGHPSEVARPGGTIQLQHDNATPHSVTTMPEIKEALVQDGFNMTFDAQPAQSPDMNILDLGYFRSIETLHFQNDCNTVQDLLDSVQSSFKSLHVDVLDNTFITLQLVLGKTLEFLGDNCFKPPHINKQKKRKNGHLLPSISCSQIVLAKCDAELVRRGLLFQV